MVLFWFLEGKSLFFLGFIVREITFLGWVVVYFVAKTSEVLGIFASVFAVASVLPVFHGVPTAAFLDC